MTQNSACPILPERINGLGKLSMNLYWSWNPKARMLFKLLGRMRWKESIHNPVKMLSELPLGALEKACKSPSYLRLYDEVMAEFEAYMVNTSRWFDAVFPRPQKEPLIAYFSFEYGLHRSLPIYAGGLGVLAGDHLKESSDLGVPVVGIGLFYPEGYVHQRLTEQGWQEEHRELINYNYLPMERVKDKAGKWLIVRVPVVEPAIYVSVWRVQVGRVPLYLMDTNIEANDPWNREISARLYMGDPEERLRQEIVLGLGGIALLRTLGLQDFMVHLNEGHPAFALLEHARGLMERGLDFEQAKEYIYRTSLFTTHTPVPAGIDVFSYALIEKYFHPYWEALGLSREAFFKLGLNPVDPNAGFNMAVFALKMCHFANAVSKKHLEVSKDMWKALWRDKRPEEIPIFHVTNGVHVPTWVDPKVGLLFDRHLGRDWLEHHDNQKTWSNIQDVPDKELWELHIWLKTKLLNIMRERARRRWARDKVPASVGLAQGALLDPFVLTLGFARRFAAYKRADLILSDPERLKRIVSNPLRPVQVIFAGKAHPDDSLGKRILQNVFNVAKDPAFCGRIAFVEDYGEQTAQYLVHGVDAWLNNPIPPLEASGTSGMKASLNGVPNLSILDGWWVEGFNGRNGWAFGVETPTENMDMADAEALYRVLEQEIVPLYYDLGEDGIPHGWVAMMKAAIRSCGPTFSARRMLKEYAHKAYIPALMALLAVGEQR